MNNLIDLPILYLSGYIIKNKNSYYRYLREVTYKQNWEDWILYMLDAVEQTAISTTQKVNKIKSLWMKPLMRLKSNYQRFILKNLLN